MVIHFKASNVNTEKYFHLGLVSYSLLLSTLYKSTTPGAKRRSKVLKWPNYALQKFSRDKRIQLSVITPLACMATKHLAISLQRFTHT